MPVTLDEREYEEKKERERAYYEGRKAGRGLAGRLLHNRLLFDIERISANYGYAKGRMEELVEEKLGGRTIDRLLIAPCGEGGDVPYLERFARAVHGIDLSPVAVGRCPARIQAKVGDILDSGYPDESFDLVASTLFFHHLGRFGFEPFLAEFRRMMRKGSGIVILEPSFWYPLNIVTRPLKRTFGNPFGEVEDEGPIRPGRMLDALRRAGFVNVQVRGASMSHCAFHAPLARAVNALFRPVLKRAWIGRVSWMALYWAEKA